MGQRSLGPEALRALAHPLRVQLLERLAVRREATASMLARDLGESSGATSYHLRQLARHGMIHEVADRGTAKERWWRRTPDGLTVGIDDFTDPATAPAATAVIMETVRGKARRLRHWMDTAFSDWSREWIEASLHADANLRLAPAQLKALVAELQAVVDRYRELPPGPDSAPVEIQLDAFPKPDPQAAP